MKKNKLKYRLGLDLGTNSIGWCMLKLNMDNEPIAVIKSGVRIFHDGRNEKSKEPMAVVRRNARSARRNLDRKISRRNHLLNTLIKYNLLPKDESERKALSLLNPYELRNRAVNEKIELFELGRLLMHLSKRRGFKSNRKVDKEDSSGKIKPAIERLKAKMNENNKKTVGEYLYYLLQSGTSVRARLGKVNGKEGYEIYLDRALIQEEYNFIMQEQSKYYQSLTEDIIKEIFNIIFYQRPLKPQKIGKCSLVPEDAKMKKAHVLAQDFILLQKIHDLRVYDGNIMEIRQLNIDEKLIIKRELKQKEKVSYENIRKLLKKNYENRQYGKFNFEAINKDLQGNKTNAIMSKKDILGNKWDEFSTKEKYEIIEQLFSDKSNDDLIKIYEEHFKLNESQINGLLDKAIYKLDSGYIRYGKTAVTKLNNIMDNDNLDLHHAKIKAGYEEKKRK